MSGVSTDRVSSVNIVNEKNIQPKHGEEDEEEHEEINFVNSKKDSNNHHKISVLEHGCSTDVSSPFQVKVDESTSAQDIPESALKTTEEKFDDFQKYEEVDIHSVPLDKTHDKSKPNKTEEDMPLYSEVKEVCHDHKSAKKKVNGKANTKVTNQEDLVTSGTKEAPVYSVVNLELKKNRKKALTKDRKSKSEEESSEADVQPPIYSVVDLKSKKSKRKSLEKESLKGADDSKKNPGMSSKVEASAMPLYSIVNLALKKSRRAKRETDKGEREEEKESSGAEALLNEDSDAIPMYAVVNLKDKKCRRTSNEDRISEESENEEHKNTLSDEETDQTLLDANKLEPSSTQYTTEKK